MYDETEYGRESLWSHDMAQYQGPALYVYNNAVFTTEDWNGIQEIARSRKRDDPLKVGRFGIGFNSVYHITDVPSIFSGDQIGMLDPHQTLFGPHESGQCWNLKMDIKEITEHTDQFAPYIGLFGSSEKTIKDGSFPGTLFRFPLRVRPSQLSGNIYNKEKVLELFESFKADADTVLLFLKSVQEVSLHARESDGTERMLFRVTASEDPERKLERPSSLKTLGLAIDSYSNGVLGGKVTCATYQVNIETQDETAKETQSTTWLVCNGVGGRGMCGDLDTLADDLKFIPAIGIALPLTPVDDDEGASSGFSGRAFCFLPLPLGEESTTGLPVHVSGFFGLTDNRRSIKWREVDQWRDPAALWNELLVVTVIPRAYFTLVMEVIKRIQTKEDQDFPLSAQGSYRAWPDPSRVRAHWKPILEPLFQDLIQQPVIYSLSGDWITVDQAVFSELDDGEDSTEAVISYLQSSGMRVAKVPAAVDAVLAAYPPTLGKVAKVTPALVRHVLRKTRHKGSSQEKLLLLEFVLSDGCYSDLIGLELLPLQNDTFVAFSSSVNEKDAVYIASDEYPRSLYPGLEGRFILESIKPTVMNSLKEAAKSRGRPCIQVQELTPERSARLIKEILTTTWPSRDFSVQWNPGNQEKKHPSISWLKMTWKHLYIYFADDLSIFEDMPLIPQAPLEDGMDSVELLRLRTPSPIIFMDEEEAPVPEGLPDVMKKLGGIVMKKLDLCLQHPLLKNYIHPSSPSALLQMMDRSTSQRVVNQISSLSSKQKVALRGFLAGLSEITEKEKRILQELAIFEKIGPCTEKGTPIFIALKGAKALHHSAKLPSDVRLSINIIDSSDEAAIRLIKILNVEQESPYKYNGTLFRLPFRTEQEASVSEISSIYYNTTDIYSLVDEFSICGHRLILFTQHVGSMVLKYLKYEEPNPAAAQDVVTMNKSVWSSKATYGPLSILKAAAKVMKKVANTNRVPADVPKSGCIIRIVVEEFHNVFRRIVDLQSPLFRGSDEDPSSYFEMAAKGAQNKRLTDEMPQKAVDLTNWLICSCMDVTEALKFSLSESGRRLGLVPCGAKESTKK
ncbi:hypothetical protein MATL_G00114550 [Megalops atlanticus]|uniref:Sacsin/Nov domain-containing protein n=1 Tax=Megalops atlanticus TaxID=7932 RepID=A0A9D3PWJ1_MEGAT|nr:hypothetical protein MATL_G00114550 [Megalops atlanticus]